MSKISLSPSPTGSAVYTIASPAGSTDRTLNLPDSAGTVATAESTLAQFNVTGSAPVFACRAFVNFNGTGTVAIRGSGNVSSITDNGTGDYTVNFATAMPDANYATNGMSAHDAQTIPRVVALNRLAYQTAASCRIMTGFTGSQASGGGIEDAIQVQFAVFR